MYKRIKATSNRLKGIASYEGETQEERIRRILNNKEPISDGAQNIYTERKDGVLPEYDIRHDPWETAVEAMSKVEQSKTAERNRRIEAKEEKEKLAKGWTKDDKGEWQAPGINPSIGGTDTQNGSK